MTGEKPKLKLNYTCLKRKDRTILFFKAYVYNLACQSRYAWEWISYFQLPCGCNSMVKFYMKFTTEPSTVFLHKLQQML